MSLRNGNFPIATVEVWVSEFCVTSSIKNWKFQNERIFKNIHYEQNEKVSNRNCIWNVDIY